MLKSKKSVCLVTGASQDLGSYIAIGLAQVVAPGSLLILTSRSTERLQKVQNDIQQKVGKDKVKIHLIQWDLRQPNADQYEKILKNALSGSKTEDFETAVVVHNAAQLGDMSKKVVDFKNVQELQDQLNINVVSMLVLNAVWLGLVKNVKKRVVVHMTAPSATTPRACFGQACLVKSSRQITLSVLAAEEPDIQVLHFDPGAVDTGALRAIRDESHSKDIRDWIAGFYDRNEVLTAEHVVSGLIKTVDEGKYESGGYVNAYNVK